MEQTLLATQQSVLNYLYWMTTFGHRFTPRAVADHLNLGVKTVLQILLDLKWKGLVAWRDTATAMNPNHASPVEVTEKGKEQANRVARLDPDVRFVGEKVS